MGLGSTPDQPGSVEVRIDIGERGRAEVVEVVGDDGVGLDPARPPHVGLGSMRERATEVGGSCEVTAGPTGGTLVRATLPLVSDGHA